MAPVCTNGWLRILDAVGTAVASIPFGGQPKTMLRLTAPPDIGANFLAEVATKFAAQYPSVNLEVCITNRRVDLVAEGFDAAIRAASGQLADSALDSRKLMPIEFKIFASPSYLAFRGTPLTPSDCVKHDWVALRGWKRVTEVMLPANGPRLISDDFLFLRETLRAGGGLGFLPNFLVKAEVRAGQLICVLPQLSKTGGSLTLVYPKTKQVPAGVISFRDFLVDSFGRDKSETR